MTCCARVRAAAQAKPLCTKAIFALLPNGKKRHRSPTAPAEFDVHLPGGHGRTVEGRGQRRRGAEGGEHNNVKSENDGTHKNSTKPKHRPSLGTWLEPRPKPQWLHSSRKNHEMNQTGQDQQRANARESRQPARGPADLQEFNCILRFELNSGFAQTHMN